MEFGQTYQIGEPVKVVAMGASFFTGIGVVVEAAPDRHRYTVEMPNGIRQHVFAWHLEPVEDRRRIQA
jgi:hypothetical protein